MYKDTIENTYSLNAINTKNNHSLYSETQALQSLELSLNMTKVIIIKYKEKDKINGIHITIDRIGRI